MAECAVPVSEPEYSPPISYNSDLFGGQPSLNTEYNCDVQGGQYPYAEQDHLALRHLAFKNFVRPRTLAGDTVFKPVDETQFSCDCNLSRTPLTAKYNNESLKFEVKSGVIKRGCDCIKRNGLQDRCPRVRHESRWECLMGMPHGCTSGPAKLRAHYANHLQRPARPPYSNPCASASDLSRARREGTTATHCQNKPRTTTVDQLRCVRSQMLTKNGYSNVMKGNNTSVKSQPLSSCTPKHKDHPTNIVCSCRAF